MRYNAWVRAYTPEQRLVIVVQAFGVLGSTSRGAVEVEGEPGISLTLAALPGEHSAVQSSSSSLTSSSLCYIHSLLLAVRTAWTAPQDQTAPAAASISIGNTLSEDAK